ncbi:MAG: redoxin domain-containing protein [Proteobacteria bacterium]|nr:redoxin domain-containing protein [Pseudomonadota bacterium]
MPKLFTIALLSAAVLWHPSAQAADVAVAVDKPAPDFTLPGEDGKSHKLSDYKGNVVVLEWFNKDCPFVRKHYDTRNMQDLQKESTDKGVVWLSIVSSAEGNQGYITAEEALQVQEKEQSHQTHILLDPKGDVGRLYGAKTTPHMFVINRDGVLVYAGAIDNKANTIHADARMARNYVREALDEILAGGAVTEKVTIPYGCSVKY